MIPRPDPAAPGETGDGGDGELAVSVRTGLHWKIGGQAFAEGCRIVVAVVLAHRLTPADYGVAGLALVSTSFISIFSDPAFGSALIQRPAVSDLDRSTAFWTTTVLGLAATALAFLVAGPVAEFFGQPRVADLLRLASLGIALASLSTVHGALLTRDLAFRGLELRQIGSALVGAAVAIGLALSGAGPWAIVGGAVASAAVASLGTCLVSPWQPKLIFSRNSLRELGAYGARVFGVRLVGWSNQNMDSVLIGRFIGARQLGAYSLAYNAMFLPTARIALPIQSVLSPAFAALQGQPERLERAWLSSKRISGSVTVPMNVVLLVTAPDLLHVVFGSKWSAAIVPLQLLCIAGVALSLLSFHGGLLVATGHAGVLLRLAVASAVVTLGAFALGVPFGITGVAGFYAAAKWILFPVDLVVTSRAVGFSTRRAFRVTTEVIPFALAATGIGVVVRAALVSASLPPASRLVVVAAAVIASYVALVAAFAPDLVSEARRLLPSGLRRRGSAPGQRS